MVSYYPGVDDVFRALADPTRRALLDALTERDGQTLVSLSTGHGMTRVGVAKHLRLLEDAGLVVTKRRGREKLHFLNPVPIRLVHDRWVSKYAEPWAAALTGIKRELEEQTMESVDVQHRVPLTPDPEGERERIVASASGRLEDVLSAWSWRGLSWRRTWSWTPQAARAG